MHQKTGIEAINVVLDKHKQDLMRIPTATGIAICAKEIKNKISMKKNSIKIVYAFIALFCLTPLAWSQQPRYLSTGIGIDQREQSHDDYSAKIIFFVNGGAYLAYINVTVLDAKGKVIFQGTSIGPWFFIDLAAGNYQVIATRKNSDKQSARFSGAAAGQRSVPLLFPNR